MLYEDYNLTSTETLLALFQLFEKAEVPGYLGTHDYGRYELAIGRAAESPIFDLSIVCGAY